MSPFTGEFPIWCPLSQVSPARAWAQFEAWSEADPPDMWEADRDARIEAVEGEKNPFVVEAK
jgi:endonuclease I